MLMRITANKMQIIRLAMIIFFLLFLGHAITVRSRWIKNDRINLASNGSDLLEWRRPLYAKTETCEPTYGILPCSSNVWGLLFLIVVYEILLSFAGNYVSTGSNLFFEIIGPGVFGASLFQILGTIPQVVLVLVSALSGTTEAAQQRATLGMGLVAGTTVMLLTLIWGTSIILGSYNLSDPSAVTTDASSGAVPKTGKTNVGVVTDAETSYTARIMLISLIPFVILLLEKIFRSSSARRVIILVALIVTFVLLFGYILYQIFQPWVQNRRFEYLMNKYAKDKLLSLFSRNGQPDTRKIQSLFDRIDKDKSTSVSAAELRVLLLGVRMDNESLNTDRDVESILASFDASGDGRIDRDEFTRGMQALVTNLSEQTTHGIKKPSNTNVSQNNTTNSAQQGLLSTGPSPSPSLSTTTQRATSSWQNYLSAFSQVILGTAMLCVFSEPMIKSVVLFAQTANISPFNVSYLAIPFAMNYGAAVQSIASATQKTQRSISLTLSSLYSGVYMNNVIGLIVYLGPVYARNLSGDVFAEISVVLIICIAMTVFVSFRTVYARWMGYVVLLLYPISLALVYFVTMVLGFP